MPGILLSADDYKHIFSSKVVLVSKLIYNIWTIGGPFCVRALYIMRWPRLLSQVHINIVSILWYGRVSGIMGQSFERTPAICHSDFRLKHVKIHRFEQHCRHYHHATSPGDLNAGVRAKVCPSRAGYLVIPRL